MRLTVSSAAVLVLAVGVLGCLGDRWEDVTVRNGSAAAVLVYDGAYDYPKGAFRIEAGMEAHTDWMWPIDHTDFRARRVRAERPDGSLVFCREYRYQDLAAAKWVITIVSGTVECGH